MAVDQKSDFRTDDNLYSLSEQRFLKRSNLHYTK